MVQFIRDLQDRPFINEINRLGEVYLVGGVVRDLYLNSLSKDIDLVVRMIKMDDLIKLLKKFGTVNVVGQFFGIIKFKEFGITIEYDIALPRTEIVNNMGGHRGFDIAFDANLNIEDDLIRRDIKINSIAIKLRNGQVIDPLMGVNDIKNKVLSVSSTKTFVDDPLRLLRIVQFASRLSGFTIEPNTLVLIQQNAYRINEISKERIFEELEKIVQKGNARVGAEWLVETGLFKFIFGGSDYDGDINIIPDKVKSIGEFIFLLLFNQPKPHLIFANRMKRVASVEKEIEALNLLKHSNGEFEDRVRITLAYGLFPDVINSTLIDPKIMAQIPDFISGKYPLSNKHLAVNGEDLMRIGITGTGIGSTIRKITTFIFQDALQNDKDAILNYLLQN